ncbi:hypothetical protein [Laceyella tengchongensis]|uniref:hypothetical protein n=1 Tax=Laceyella tengchongensis TaxID=574699 RepID=UPI002547A62A|nr:hypothetical protein [Laceyella tengchongensis]
MSEWVKKTEVVLAISHVLASKGLSAQQVQEICDEIDRLFPDIKLEVKKYLPTADPRTFN